ncbi:hypothetical protein KK062_07970 [Fulvivirgaceae bacterium PWU5]|uniref:Uncharacterized protein n=1 Tax=Dawidia cretensis TaxID=2782350 RepID=A0AAP2DV59_9BACT|nr:hypothetical protein [Dawidia cretensis]MBT1708155.1 hypothetical protein [Dawidia cretensis]
MPFLEGPFAFTGKLDMLSAYRMRGVDKIVVRRKGGPSGEKVKTSPSFENTRRTMSEFGGCSRHGSYVRMAMHQLRRLSDYNFGSDINSIMRQVQLRDGTSEWGRRSITLSEHTRLLEGFSTMYKAPSFDSIVRTPVYYTMDRANRSARIEIAELIRDINYFPQNNHAMFRLTVTLGIVPDVTFDVAAKEYLPPTWYDPSYYSIDISTGWNPSLEGMESTVLELAMNALPPDNRWTLMLSIGIEYGAFREGGKIDEVKRFGSAKILALRGKEDVPGGGLGDDEMGEEEFNVADEAVIEDLPIVKVKKVSEGFRQPEMRYVYSLKEAVVEKPEVKVYRYAIPVIAQKENIISTAETSVMTSVVDQPVVYISLLPEGSRDTANTPGTSDVPALRSALTLAPAVDDQPRLYYRPVTGGASTEKAAPENWNGFSAQVRTSSG